MMWTVAVDKIDAEFPQRWKATGQMTLNTAQNCIGRVAGSLVGGLYLYHGQLFGMHGGRALYTLAAISSATLLVLHAGVSALLRLCGSRALMTPPPPREQRAAVGRPVN